MADGNASLMREALKGMLSALADMGFAPFREGDHLLVAIHRANAALAASPRNCDRFGSYEDALDYWREHVECAEDNGSFDVWLMARAEGGAE